MSEPPRVGSGRVCRVCGGAAVDIWWSDATRGLYRCRACDARSLQPRPPAADLARIYSEDYFRTHYLAHESLRIDYFRPLVAALERRTAGRRVLDLGCGPGFFLKAATQSGWQAAGVDIAPAAVAHAHASGLTAECAELDAYTPPFRPDVVTMWDVIAHVPDPTAFVSSAAALLEPGGLLVIKFPYRRRLLYRIAGLFSTTGMLALTSQPHHFSPSSIARLLESAGCRLVAAERVDEIELPARAGDSRRLRMAKLVTRAMVGTGLYQSIVAYGERMAVASR